MTQKLVDLWLFDNYESQEGGNTRNNTINELLEVLEEGKPIKTYLVSFFGIVISENFINLIKTMNSNFFENRNLKNKMNKIVGIESSYGYEDPISSYFTSIDMDNYERQIPIKSVGYTTFKLSPLIIDREKVFEDCVKCMEDHLLSINELHLYVRSPGHAMGVYYKKISSDPTKKCAFYFINTGKSSEYQDMNNNCKDNGGIMCFIIDWKKVCKFLTYIYIFDGAIPTNNFYNILIYELLEGYTSENNNYINQYKEYLFQIQTPLQIIGNCSFKAMIYLLEILWIQNVRSINYEKRTFKDPGSQSNIVFSLSNCKISLSPEFNLFYNLSKLELLITNEIEVNNKLKELSNNIINLETYEFIQKLNDQYIFLNKSRIELFDDQIKKTKNLDKDYFNEIIDRTFNRIRTLNDEILTSVYTIIEKNMDQCITEDINNYYREIEINELSAINRNQGFSYEFINKNDTLNKEKADIRATIVKIKSLLDQINSERVTNISGLINIINFIYEYCTKIIDYRNVCNNIIGVKYYISLLPSILFNKVLKSVKNNNIRITSNEQKIAYMLHKIYFTIYLLNSDYYCNYDDNKHHRSIDPENMDIIMVKDYFQIAFLSIIVISSLLININKMNIENHLENFRMYMGSLMIRSKEELELIRLFEKYLVDERLYQYILVPVKDDFNRLDVVDQYLNNVDIFDNYDQIKLNYRHEYIRHTGNMTFLSENTPIDLTNYGLIGKSIMGNNPNPDRDYCDYGRFYLGYHFDDIKKIINYSTRDIIYFNKNFTINLKGGYGVFNYYIPTEKLGTVLNFSSDTDLFNKSILEVKYVLNNFDKIKYLLLFAQIKLYDKFLYYYFDCKRDKQVFINDTVLKLSIPTYDHVSYYSYLDYPYNYFSWSYGSISRIIYNVSDFVKGNSKTYTFLNILFGNKTESYKQDNDISNFSIIPNEPRSLIDLKNIPIEKIGEIVEMIEDLFNTNTINKGLYLDYEKIILNLIMILNFYEIKSESFSKLSKILKSIYDINIKLTNNVIDLLIFVLYLKNTPSISNLNESTWPQIIKVFSKFNEAYISECNLVLNNILKLTRIININKYINSSHFTLKQIDKKDKNEENEYVLTDEEIIIQDNLLKVFDILMMYQLISELIIDNTFIKKNDTASFIEKDQDYKIILEENVYNMPDFSMLTKILEYIDINTFIKRLMSMYKVKFLYKINDYINTNIKGEIIIKKNTGFDYRTIQRDFIFNHYDVKCFFNKLDRNKNENENEIYYYNYLSSINIYNNYYKNTPQRRYSGSLTYNYNYDNEKLEYAITIKNKDTFVKDDAILQLYFRSDYSYVNMKSYKEIPIDSKEITIKLPLSGNKGLEKAFINKDSEDKIVISLYYENYLIIVNDKKLLRMSELLYNPVLSKCYFKIFLCINSNYTSRPGHKTTESIIYDTDIYNDLLVLDNGDNNIYEFYCPQIKARWILNIDKDEIYYGDWTIKLTNNVYPYYVKRYTYNTNIMIGTNDSGKYIYIGSYIKNRSNDQYTGIYELEVSYNDIFLEKNILILGYFLKENLNAFNINESNNILAMILKNTNLLDCYDEKLDLNSLEVTKSKECSLENTKVFGKYILDLNLLSEAKSIYLRYFVSILQNIFVLTIKSNLLTEVFDNISVGEIDFYIKINKLYFPYNVVSFNNISLNCKDFTEINLDKEILPKNEKFIKETNAYYAIIFIITYKKNPNLSNLIYYKKAYCSIGKKCIVNGYKLKIPLINRNLIRYGEKISYMKGEWETLINLEEVFHNTGNTQNNYSIIEGIKEESFNKDYIDFINSSGNIYILSKMDLNRLKVFVIENIKETQIWYNENIKIYNTRYQNNFNINFTIIENITNYGKIFLNKYLNLKKLFLLKEQIESLLNVDMSQYDCTEIYNLISIKPLYDKSEQTINLAYFEYLSGFIVRQKQFEFTQELFAELKKESGHRQKIHQMLMGEGKSSTIAPLITLLLLEDNHNNNTNKTIIHVMPNSLVPQSYSKIFNNIFFFLNMNLLQKIQSKKNLEGKIIMPEPLDLFKKPITIISDYLIKVSKIKIADSELSDQQSIKEFYKKSIGDSYLIFDEVDEIADPLKSQLNMIDLNIKFEKIDNEVITYNFIYKFIYTLYFNKKTQRIRDLLKDNSFRIVPHLFLDTNNIDEKASKTLNEYYDWVIEKIFKKRYKEAYNKLIKNEFQDYKKINIGYLNLIYNFGKTYRGVLRQLHRRHFGLKFNSRSDISVLYTSTGSLKDDEKLKEYFVAVPFVADEKPSEKSEFTDHLFIIALTIICYCDDPVKRLRKIDLQLYLEKIKELWIEQMDLSDDNNDGIIKYKNLTKDITDPPTLTKKLSINSFEDYDIIKLINNFPLEYYLLEIIFKKFIKVIKYVNNLSFIDIMSSNYCDRRVGFTGTPFISIPREVNPENELEKVQKQLGADGAVIASILGLKEPNKILVLNNTKDIIEYALTNGYRAIIDCGSIFINNNSYYIAKGIIDFVNDYNKNRAESLKHYVKCVVFLNENDVPIALDLNYNIVAYDSLTIDLVNRFYYYDQGHITGIDLKIYLLAKGLITVSSFNRFRDIAQGIFRLRKINRGQTVDFVINNNLNKVLPNNNPVSLVNYLVENELTYNSNQKPLFNKQNIQTIYRNYFENEIPPIERLNIPTTPQTLGSYFTYLNVNIYRQPIYLNFNEERFLKYDLLKFSKDEFEYLITNKITNEAIKKLINEIIAKTNFGNSQESSAQMENEEQQEQQKHVQQELEQVQQHTIFKIEKCDLVINNLFKVKALKLQKYLFNNIGNEPNVYYLNKNIKESINNYNIIPPDYSIYDTDKKIGLFYQKTKNIQNLGNIYYLDNYNFVNIKTDNEINEDIKKIYPSVKYHIVNYKPYAFRILAPSIYTCEISQGKLFCYMEIYNNLDNSDKFVLDHYILLKNWEVNTIINFYKSPESNKYPSYKIRIIIPGDIIIFSNINDNEIFKSPGQSNIEYLDNNIKLIKVLLHDKSITNKDILKLFDMLYFIKQKYGTSSSTEDSIYNNIFGDKYNYFENFMVKKYVGKLKLTRFLNLITLFRFISESDGSGDYTTTVFNIHGYISKCDDIIKNTIKKMKECKQPDLAILIVNLETDYSSNKESFSNDFWLILVNSFGAENNGTEYNFDKIFNKSKNIKKFWIILKDIFEKLPSIKQTLCDYVNIGNTLKEEIGDDEVELLVKNFSSR